jgi:HAE1 family hydrophobic/amphiphilic exporter-1
MVINLAVPLSLVIALAVMYFAGESLNILTLLALMVSVGLLVDNSVVVAENIDRVYKTGLSRRDSAIQGSGEIALAITMSTLTTVVVFLPVALVGGPAQFFLLRMAIPISVALLASLLVALVYIPLTVYLTLPADGREDAHPTGPLERPFRRAYEATFGRINRWYARVLAVCLRRRLDMVIAVLVVFALTMGITKEQITFTDIQENEEAGFEIDVELPDTYTLEETEEWFLQAEAIVEQHAEELGLEGWFLFHLRTRGELQGWFTTPRSTKLTPREVTERVVELIPPRPGIELTTGEEDQREDGQDEGVYRVTLTGEDPERLESLADDLSDALTRVDGVLGVRKDSESAPNELGLVVDRDRVQRYGVDPRTLAGVVGYALRGQSLPKYRDKGKEIPVRVRYQESDRASLEDLASFYVPTESGDFLPVSALTDVRMLDTPEMIRRVDKRISRVVTFDLMTEEEDETRERLDAMVAGIDLPEGITFGGGASAADLDEDLAGLQFAGLLSVVFIYLLMGLLFESFILPLSIVLTIPLASLGVLWAHILTGLDIDFLGSVGIVLLIGVVVNNGIVLVDYVNRLREEGTERHRALLIAADRRFRPIMMTAITTIGGMIPLAVFGRMDSGISYTSFAITLIGGMTTATLLTLLVVPVFYTFFDDARETFGASLRAIRGGRRGARGSRSREEHAIGPAAGGIAPASSPVRRTPR